jgi:hypothetical protein
MTNTPTNVDIYDGHLLETYVDGEELVHDVIHPPTCEPCLLYSDPDVPGSDIIGHRCAVAFCLDSIGPDECFEAAQSPGVRIVGWRHDTYGGGCTPIEHDVVTFCLPQAVTAAYRKAAVDPDAPPELLQWHADERRHLHAGHVLLDGTWWVIAAGGELVIRGDRIVRLTPWKGQW